MSYSRRHFLRQTSFAAGAGILARIPKRQWWSTAPSALIPAPDEARLRESALRAIDVARAAGATYADIRLTAGRTLGVGSMGGHGREPEIHIGMPPVLLFNTRYGIRAIVDGAWGFATGTDESPDAVARTAEIAVALARANRSRRRRTLELAPVDRVSNGLWETKFEKDPLDVPLGEQAELAFAAVAEASKRPEVDAAEVGFQWRRPTSVFASTDGSLITFRYALAMPGGGIRVSVGPDRFDGHYGGTEGLLLGPHGYEALNGNALIDAMRTAVEREIALVRASRHPDVGDTDRYDLVFSAGAVASLVITTLCDALNAERALGYRANGTGTSFAAPPGDMLGRYQVASPLITLRGDRSRPGGAATIAWDDEGAVPRDYTFIERGIITDYHTSRETAPQLGDWYRRRGAAERSHGIMRRCGSDLPGIYLPNLTMEPGPTPATVDDLVGGVKKGLFIETVLGSVDQQVINAQYGTYDHTKVRRIVNGKLGAYVKNVSFQFNTTRFWKSVDAIGGRDSVKSQTMATDVGASLDQFQPSPFSTIDMVPMRVRGVNVFSIGRTA